jgi:DNA-binding transcriptional ArsR family regulator
VVRYRFAQDDLLRTRFAIAPLMELVGALYVLREPERFAVHEPWARWAAPRAARLDLTLLDVAAPAAAPFWPVFIGPPPRAPHAAVADELERVLATPPAQVAEEIARAHPDGVPRAGRVLVDNPARGVPRLVEQMRALWDVAIAPWWSAIAALLESEIAWRARRLAAVGPQAAFSGLHESVSFADGVLSVDPTTKAPAVVDLAGRGLLLVPAAFVWPIVWPRSDAPWDPALVYPPPGTAALWEPGDGQEEALEQLLGRGRARVLLELERPAATLDLAERLAVSPGGVSEHLKVLRRAGLVVGRREGRRVIYARTAKGDGLC